MSGTVYLLHLSEPLSTINGARHYLGYASILRPRLTAHAQGTGARFTQVAWERGVGWILARTWKGGRTLERRLKRRHSAPRLCPLCKGENVLKGTIIGNLGNDPDMRYSANGTAVLRFNVASNYRARTPEGEYEDRTEWVRVTVMGNRAEALSQYLTKGMRVYCEGRLEARPWTDQQGNVRAGLELTANEIQFFSDRRQRDGDDEEQPRQQQRPAPQAQRQQRPAPQDDDLEDLPF